MTGKPPQSLFEEKLAKLLTEHGFDTVCRTPNWILATAVVDFLAGVGMLVQKRDKVSDEGQRAANPPKGVKK